MRLVTILVTLLMAGSSVGHAANLITLASFAGSNGSGPVGGVKLDGFGNIVGTTYYGGSQNLGTIFSIASTGTGYARGVTTLFNFDGPHGANPLGFTVDPVGNLLGTSTYGGALNLGTIYELYQTATGYQASPTVLFSFDSSTGQTPYAAPIINTQRNMFGTALGGGLGHYGTVWELVKTTTDPGWRLQTLLMTTFNYSNGSKPIAGLVVDNSLNLFGTTQWGGIYGYGTVFEIVRVSTGFIPGSTVLINFNNDNGASPCGELILDAAGNLYGTTNQGGKYNMGTIFKVAKTATGYASTPTTLLHFNGTNGAYPQSALLMDGAGNLFGTTTSGGGYNQGVVFKLTRTGSTYATNSTTLVTFNFNPNGGNPGDALIADANGNLLSTTYAGGANGLGTVFEVTGSGYVLPQ